MNADTDYKRYTKDDLEYFKFDIASANDFVTEQEASSIIEYFKMEEQVWGPSAFYNSEGMGFAPSDPRLPGFGLPENFFATLRERFRQACEAFFERPLKPNTSHAQKWEVGGFANPHSDNSDFDGNPNAFEINKYVGILYLNESYEGGLLFFPDHKIEIAPKTGQFIMFPGGHTNIHGVSEITSGTRYTMVSFWDYAESEYDQETLDKWKEEEKRIRKEQEVQREQWAQGIK